MRPGNSDTDLSRQTSLARPIEYACWGALAFALVSTLFLPLTLEEFGQVVLFVITVGASLLVLLHGLVPRYGDSPPLQVVATAGSIAVMAWAYYLWSPYGLRVGVFYVLVIAVIGIMSGWRLTILAAVLAILAEWYVSLLRPELATLPGYTIAKVLAYLMAGWLASSQARLMRRQADELRQRNAEMSFLLRASETASSLDLTLTLPQLAREIARGLPATLCRIYVLDQQSSVLTAEGDFPLRSLDPAAVEQSASWRLSEMPAIARALRGGAPLVYLQDSARDELSDMERSALLLDQMQSVCLMPLNVKGQTLGAIVVGEMRSWQRQPFSANRVKLLQTMAPQLAVAIQNAQLHRETQRQSDRFAVLVEVGHAVGSTIELDTLLELIHQQLDRAIPSDTYFVGLYDPVRQELDLRILIDEGQRFPSKKVPLGEGLASWVVRTRQPLLIRSYSKERRSLAVNAVVVGKDRESESWLGAPMLVGDVVLGLLAVACYRPNAFGEEDIDLLNNVAQQAALAVDNARHHAAVEDQARRDSLTGVFNNRHLHKRLNEEFTHCRAAGSPLSVIMVDIDHFKQYNDTYGHVIGDEVLRHVAQTIESLVPAGSTVGRWGGEEFTIILPGMAADGAWCVAERLRSGVAEMALRNGLNRPIPAPTISQGLASYPAHADSDDALILVADRALYKAKDAGRNSITVA